MDMRIVLGMLAVVSVFTVQAGNVVSPKCISELCLGGGLRELPTEGQVNRLLGVGREAKPSVPHRKSSCIVVATPKLKGVYGYLTYIDVESKWRLVALTVASNRLCQDPEAVSLGHELLTERGIGLGSQECEIFAAYGRPAHLLDSPSSDLIRSYFPDAPEDADYSIAQFGGDQDDVVTTRFFLLQGIVVGIDISADE